MANRIDMGKLIKGLYSGAVGFLGSLTTVLVGTTTFSQVTDGQWTNACFFGLIGIGGTYGLAGWSGPGGNGGDHGKPTGT